MYSASLVDLFFSAQSPKIAEEDQIVAHPVIQFNAVWHRQLIVIKRQWELFAQDSAYQDDIQTKYTGGTVLHAFLGEALPSADAVRKLVRKISYIIDFAFIR